LPSLLFRSKSLSISLYERETIDFTAGRLRGVPTPLSFFFSLSSQEREKQEVR
jgi:hypothetical protein